MNPLLHRQLNAEKCLQNVNLFHDVQHIIVDPNILEQKLATRLPNTPTENAFSTHLATETVTEQRRLALQLTHILIFANIDPSNDTAQKLQQATTLPTAEFKIKLNALVADIMDEKALFAQLLALCENSVHANSTNILQNNFYTYLASLTPEAREIFKFNLAKILFHLASPYIKKNNNVANLLLKAFLPSANNLNEKITELLATNPHLVAAEFIGCCDLDDKEYFFRYLRTHVGLPERDEVGYKGAKSLINDLTHLTRILQYDFQPTIVPNLRPYVNVCGEGFHDRICTERLEVLSPKTLEEVEKRVRRKIVEITYDIEESRDPTSRCVHTHENFYTVADTMGFAVGHVPDPISGLKSNVVVQSALQTSISKRYTPAQIIRNFWNYGTPLVIYGYIGKHPDTNNGYQKEFYDKALKFFQLILEDDSLTYADCFVVENNADDKDIITDIHFLEINSRLLNLLIRKKHLNPLTNSMKQTLKLPACELTVYYAENTYFVYTYKDADGATHTYSSLAEMTGQLVLLQQLLPERMMGMILELLPKMPALVALLPLRKIPPNMLLQMNVRLTEIDQLRGLNDLPLDTFQAILNANKSHIRKLFAIDDTSFNYTLLEDVLESDEKRIILITILLEEIEKEKSQLALTQLIFLLVISGHNERKLILNNQKLKTRCRFSLTFSQLDIIFSRLNKEEGALFFNFINKGAVVLRRDEVATLIINQPTHIKAILDRTKCFASVDIFLKTCRAYEIKIYPNDMIEAFAYLTKNINDILIVLENIKTENIKKYFDTLLNKNDEFLATLSKKCLQDIIAKLPVNVVSLFIQRLPPHLLKKLFETDDDVVLLFNSLTLSKSQQIYPLIKDELKPIFESPITRIFSILKKIPDKAKRLDLFVKANSYIVTAIIDLNALKKIINELNADELEFLLRKNDHVLSHIHDISQLQEILNCTPPSQHAHLFNALSKGNHVDRLLKTIAEVNQLLKASNIEDYELLAQLLKNKLQMMLKQPADFKKLFSDFTQKKYAAFMYILRLKGLVKSHHQQQKILAELPKELRFYPITPGDLPNTIVSNIIPTKYRIQAFYHFNALLNSVFTLVPVFLRTNYSKKLLKKGLSIEQQWREILAHSKPNIRTGLALEGVFIAENMHPMNVQEKVATFHHFYSLLREGSFFTPTIFRRKPPKFHNNPHEAERQISSYCDQHPKSLITSSWNAIRTIH